MYRLTPLIFLFVATTGYSQINFPASIKLEPIIPEGFTGLQSFSWAKDGNFVLLVGGRTDGLHKRQPFAAFNKQNNNTDIIVLDLKKQQTYKQSVNSLPVTIAEQLQSTNMQFYQDGNQLILTGGYGYSETKRNHITHAALISIQVKELIDAVINNKSIQPYISQLADERMAVTGGRLRKLNDIYYLVGGQRFDGRYNPHGPNHGPGFTQQYTNQIRKFKLNSIKGNFSIDNYMAITDSLLLHRRDYNLLPQIDDNGNEMLTIYSGVFQYEKDIPFTSLVDINETSYKEVPGFNQQFSHYHTASLPIYSSTSKTMYALFFGGIAQQYINSSEKIVTDNNTPFVKTISIVERNSDTVKEYILKEPMPGYFGTAAEFIPASDKLFYKSGVLNWEKVSHKSQLVGYIIGGIDSRAPNVFWSNESDASRASPVIWEVYIAK